MSYYKPKLSDVEVQYMGKGIYLLSGEIKRERTPSHLIQH